MSRFSREVLLEIKWYRNRIDQVRIEYVNRGSPGNRAFIRGHEIDEIDRSYLILEDETRIPYHRIESISLKGEIIWRRSWFQ